MTALEIIKNKILSLDKYQLFFITLFLFLSLIFSDGMFSAGPADGFYSQMYTIDNHFGRHNILEFTHLVRFLIVYPFWLLSEIKAPYFIQSLLLLIYLSPLLLMDIRGEFKKSRYIILIMPFLFSYRTVLVMAAINILYFYTLSDNKNKVLLLFALLLSNLSSGVIIPFIFIFVVLKGHVKLKRKTAIAFALLASIVTVPSVLHKAYYFSEGIYKDKQVMELKTEYKGLRCEKNDTICTILKSNTIYMSFFTGNIYKQIFYLSLYFLLFICSIYSCIKRDKIAVFFLTSLIGLFAAGLWLASFFTLALIYMIKVIYSPLSEKLIYFSRKQPKKVN